MSESRERWGEVWIAEGPGQGWALWVAVTESQRNVPTLAGHKEAILEAVAAHNASLSTDPSPVAGEGPKRTEQERRDDPACTHCWHPLSKHVMDEGGYCGVQDVYWGGDNCTCPKYVKPVPTPDAGREWQRRYDPRNPLLISWNRVNKPGEILYVEHVELLLNDLEASNAAQAAELTALRSGIRSVAHAVGVREAYADPPPHAEELLVRIAELTALRADREALEARARDLAEDARDFANGWQYTGKQGLEADALASSARSLLDSLPAQEEAGDA